MKAVVYEEYGGPDVLHIAEVKTPTPKASEVQVRVLASSVEFGDLLARNFKNAPLSDFHMPLALYLPTRVYFGISKPRVKILGGEFSGEVTVVGSGVTRLKVGDLVYGYRGSRMGSYAEYLCMEESKPIAIKPANMSFEEACAIPYGALAAMSLLRKAPIRPGQKVLINGASGGVGSVLLQLAKHFGAEVTGVCGTPRVDYIRALGADDVIDYKLQDFTLGAEKYDLVIDVLGKSSFEKCRNVLTPQGCYLPVSFKLKQVGQTIRTSRSREQRVITALTSEKVEDLDFVRRLVEAGKFKVLIDRVYTMEQAAEAHCRAESGLKQGHVVISMRR